MNKYDWLNVLSHIMWIATDFSKIKCGYECKPFCRDSLDFWEGNGWVELGLSEFQGNWQDSLEERPND